MQPIITFVYGLVIGGVNRKSYIQMMELEAKDVEQTGRIKVILQDNGPIHRCREVQQLWPLWEKQGLYINFIAQILLRNEPN